MIKIELTLRKLLISNTANGDNYVSLEKHRIMAYDSKLEDKLLSGYDIVNAKVVNKVTVGGNNSNV